MNFMPPKSVGILSCRLNRDRVSMYRCTVSLGKPLPLRLSGFRSRTCRHHPAPSGASTGRTAGHDFKSHTGCGLPSEDTLDQQRLARIKPLAAQAGQIPRWDGVVSLERLARCDVL